MEYELLMFEETIETEFFSVISAGIFFFAKDYKWAID